MRVQGAGGSLSPVNDEGGGEQRARENIIPSSNTSPIAKALDMELMKVLTPGEFAGTPRVETAERSLARMNTASIPSALRLTC